MRKHLAAALLLALAGCKGQHAADPAGVIVARSAGVRFPAEAEALSQQLDQLLDKGGLPAPGPVAAVVLPHAGLQFSGEAEAAALAPLRDRAFGRVILLAPTHPGLKEGALLPTSKLVRTPLGEVPIDAAAVALLAQSGLFKQDDAPFHGEHALDAPLPMLQRAVGAVPLVPVLVGATDAEGARKLAAALRPLLDARTLVVVSTNLTHYGPRFGNAMFGEDRGATLRNHIAQADEILFKPLLAGDLDGFDKLARSTKTTFCGQDALRVLLALLPPGAVASVRRYDNSFSHDESETDDQVSYAGIVVAGSWPDVAPLPEPDRKALLDGAREALQAAVSQKPPPAPPLSSPRLLEKRGVFVTLYEDGQVRASMGQLTSDEALGRAVLDIAGAAATKDPRYPPLRADELSRIKIEVAVLGPLRPVRDMARLDLGRQGLFLQAPGHTGLLLPEPGSREEIEAALSALAEKAELPRAQWPADGLSSFEAQVVSEPGAQVAPVNGGR